MSRQEYKEQRRAIRRIIHREHPDLLWFTGFLILTLLALHIWKFYAGPNTVRGVLAYVTLTALFIQSVRFGRIRKRILRTAAWCHECGYELTPDTANCPECNAPAEHRIPPDSIDALTAVLWVLLPILLIVILFVVAAAG